MWHCQWLRLKISDSIWVIIVVVWIDPELLHHLKKSKSLTVLTNTHFFSLFGLKLQAYQTSMLLWITLHEWKCVSARGVLNILPLRHACHWVTWEGGNHDKQWCSNTMASSVHVSVPSLLPLTLLNFLLLIVPRAENWRFRSNPTFTFHPSALSFSLVSCHTPVSAVRRVKDAIAICFKWMRHVLGWYLCSTCTYCRKCKLWCGGLLLWILMNHVKFQQEHS